MSEETNSIKCNSPIEVNTPGNTRSSDLILLEPAIIYLDFGNGLNERDKFELIPVKIDSDRHQIKMEFEDRFPGQIRWDPSDCPCLVAVSEIKITTSDGIFNLDPQYLTTNGFFVHNSVVFFDTNDPWLLCPPYKKILAWCCTYEILHLRTRLMTELLAHYRGGLHLKFLSEEIKGYWSSTQKQLIEALADKAKINELQTLLNNKEVELEGLIRDSKLLNERITYDQMELQDSKLKVDQIIGAYVRQSKRVAEVEQLNAKQHERILGFDARMQEMFKTIQRMRLVNRVKRLFGMYHD